MHNLDPKSGANCGFWCVYISPEKVLRGVRVAQLAPALLQGVVAVAVTGVARARGAPTHHTAPTADRPAKLLILNAKFLVFNTQNLVLDTKFIIFTHSE